MVDSLNQTHSQSPSTKPPKPNSSFFLTNYFFSKSLTLILLLLLLSFFPSQLPEFFNKSTILTKLWDLFYLLVIGITVCYGLFSRKIETVHTSDDPVPVPVPIHSDDSYFSEISHISSIFEEGIQNCSYGFDEKPLLDGFLKGSDGKKKVNQYFLGESLVVINDQKYVLEQLSRDNKNLGSRSLDSAETGGKSVVLEDSSGGWDEIKSKKLLRGLVPTKLEEKFKETDSGSGSDSDSDSDSRISLKWRQSKSMRLGKKEDMGGVKPDERTVSGGILDFEDLKSKSKLKSRSVRFQMPSKMKDSSKNEELEGVETNNPNLSTQTSFMESKVQESYPDSVTEMNVEPNYTEVLRGFNDTLDASSEETVTEFGKNKVEDVGFDSKSNAQFVKSKSQSSSIGESSETNVKTVANTYKRGKSVRTNRSKEQVVEAKLNRIQSQTGDKVELISKPGIDTTTVKTDELSDPEPHSGEVDRKAEEFIAKFKEQIRLQKVASARKLNIR